MRLYKVFNRTIISILLLVFVSGNIKAGLMEDYYQLKKVYSGMLNYSVNITYTLYGTHWDNSPYSIEYGQFIHSKNGDYYKIATVETYATPDYKIFIDGESKVMALLPADNKPIVPVDPNNITIEMCNSIAPIEQKGNNKGYQLFLKAYVDEEVGSIAIYFDVYTYYIKKIILFYKATSLVENGISRKPRMEIVYEDYDLTPKIANDFFQLNNFVISEGKKVKVIGKYVNYKLIDSRN